MIRLGIVVPRYGPHVLGGAESFARDLAEHLPPDEFVTTVLTTCARDLRTWRNELPPGEALAGGVRVLRFPVDQGRRNARLYQHLTDRANRGEPLSLDEQVAWIENGAHSPELYRHLAHQGAGYDLLLFLPYLFGTTIYGSAIWPPKSVICPCLHDEQYATFADVRLMLRSAGGLMFLSPPEQALAEARLGVRHPKAQLVGLGLDPVAGNGARFRQKYGLEQPFLLYAGRLEPTKNVLQLVSFFQAYRQARRADDLRLVLAGQGSVPLPESPDIVRLGVLPVDDLHDAYAAASVLCQPSLVESFAIVLMEAWLAGTPALVHGQCPVTRHHLLQSSGGLYYTSETEFSAALDWFLEHPDEGQRMGALGRAYVQREFGWPAVLDRFRRAVAIWTA